MLIKKFKPAHWVVFDENEIPGERRLIIHETREFELETAVQVSTYHCVGSDTEWCHVLLETGVVGRVESFVFELPLGIRGVRHSSNARRRLSLDRRGAGPVQETEGRVHRPGRKRDDPTRPRGDVRIVEA